LVCAIVLALPSNNDITICIDFTRCSFNEGNGNYEIKPFHYFMNRDLLLGKRLQKRNTAASHKPIQPKA
jgi:hypothetical protein